MTFLLVNRVRETCISPGTGTAVLAGAALGYQTFSAGVGANNTTYYVIADQSGANWEVGYGTVGALGTTLARTTVLSSSNGGSLVNFTSGTQDVWVDYPANKSVNLDSSGYINAGGNPYLTFGSQATNPTYAAGILWYAQDNDSLTFYNGVSGNDLHLGQEVQLRVYNTTASTIPAGSAVYVTGQHSQFPTVDLANASSASTANAIGLCNTAIPVNSYGYVVVLGKYTGLNTSSFSSGDAIYLSATTAGGLTNVAPSSPNLVVPMGYCVYSNPSVGVVEVTVPLPPVNAANLTGILSSAHGGTGTTLTTGSGANVLANSPTLITPTLGVASATSVNTLNTFGFKNRLIDAGFIVNQMGYTSGTALSAGVYGHDMWKAGSGGCAYTFTQGSTGVPISITISAGSLQQVIEGALVADSTIYTLSWQGTAQGRINGGSYAASPITVTGLTAGSNLTVEFNTGTLAYPQLESGSYATSWDFRNYEQELIYCFRYYYSAPAQNYYAIRYDGSSPWLTTKFLARMRIAPTVTVSYTVIYVQAGTLNSMPVYATTTDDVSIYFYTSNVSIAVEAAVSYKADARL